MLGARNADKKQDTYTKNQRVALHREVITLYWLGFGRLLWWEKWSMRSSQNAIIAIILG